VPLRQLKEEYMKGLATVLGFFIFLALSACAPTASTAAGSTDVLAPAKAVTMGPIGTLATGEASQVTGSAQVTSLAEGKFQVTLTLSGLPANSTHMGHIHVGDCSVVGPVALGLTEISSDASGNGTVTSEIKGPLPADAYIAYHQRGPTDPEGVGSFITCGNIPK
jgi:hypothetical protein